MKILGLGNALVDIMILLNEDSYLLELGLPKGSMQLVDRETSEKLMNSIQNFKKEITSGGSAANTIHGLARLGLSTGYIGKIGNDDLGKFYLDDLKNSNINAHVSISNHNPTGRALAFISSDGERTFATYLGAAIELNTNDVSEQILKNYDLIHIEGYLVQNYELMTKAAEIAKKYNLKVSLDLASYNIVAENKAFLLDYIKKYVDIVFANEEEASTLTELNENDAAKFIGNHCELAIVKIGKRGSIVYDSNNDKIELVDAVKANSIDTTGAGDIYAAGFLYGLSKNYDLKKCAEIGTILASNVIEVIGAKIPDNKWEILKKQIA